MTKLWQKVVIHPDKNIWIKNGKRVDVSIRDTYNHDAIHLCASDPKLDGEIGFIRKVYNYPLDNAIVRPIKEGVEVFPVEVMILGKTVLVSNVEVFPTDF